MTSLYEALVAKAQGKVPNYSEFLSNDGHDAVHAVPLLKAKNEPRLPFEIPVNITRVHEGLVNIGYVKQARWYRIRTEHGVAVAFHWDAFHRETARHETGFYTQKAAEYWVKLGG